METLQTSYPGMHNVPDDWLNATFLLVEQKVWNNRTDFLQENWRKCEFIVSDENSRHPVVRLRLQKSVQCNRHHVQTCVCLSVELQFLERVFFYSICSSVKKLLTSRVHWYGPLKKNRPKAGTFTEMQFCFALLLSPLRSGEFVGRPCFCHKRSLKGELMKR